MTSATVTASTSMRAGFVDPVTGGQAAFRALMDAMARPGTVQAAGELLSPPGGLMQASAALLLSVCDFETTLWIDGDYSADVADWLRFHTGAVLVEEPARATFALTSGAGMSVRLADLAQGIAAFPDRSTTLLVEVRSLSEGPARVVSGPGIAGTATLAASDLPEDFDAQWTANRAGFPLGVDLVLVNGHAFVALPRSMRVVAGSDPGGRG